MKAAHVLVMPITALLLTVSTAAADPITFDYTISSPSVGNNNTPANTASFQIVPGGVPPGWGGSSPDTITAGTYYWGGWNFIATPLIFTNVPISVTVTLTDAAAKAGPGAVPSGTLVFNDLLSGQWDHAMDGWNLTAFPSTQTITLGSPGQFHTYVVNAPYLWNPSFGTLLAAASVAVSNYQPGLDPAPGTVSAAPEPATFFLAAVGLAGLIAGRCAVRRKGTRPAL